MKKIIFTVCMLALAVVGVYAGNDKPITKRELPVKAQQLLDQYFSGSTIALAKVDKEFMNATYDVVLSDGAKLEFNKNGDWKEIDCRYTGVPLGLIPSQIIQKVNELYSEAKIIKIDKDRKDYEVKLNNGLDLVFDLKFNLVEIDD